MDLSHVHPDYASMARRWQMAEDFWRGASFVTQPRHSVAKYAFQVNSTAPAASSTETNPEPERAKTAYEFTPASPWKSYLFPHETEKANEFERRCAAAYHEPHFAPLINDVVSSILRTPPQRDGGEVWDGFWRDVDGAGTPVEPFFQSQAQWAFVFGRHHILCDLPRVEGEMASRAEEIASGIRPYWVEVTARALRNWRVDERGRYVWIVVAEEPPDDRAPGEPYGGGPEWMRVWTANDWTLYSAPEKTARAKVSSAHEAEAAGWKKHAEGTHKFKRVPLVDMFVARGAGRLNMECESPFAAQVDLDRHLFNEASEIWEVDRTQSFSSLWVQMAEGETIAPIDIGPGRVHGYPVGTNPPSYASPAAELNRSRWERHLAKRAQGRSSAGIGRGAAEESKEQRSAEAIVEEMHGQLSQMAGWASDIQTCDHELHRLTAIAQGESPDKAPKASYLRSFYRMAVLSAANTINQLNTTQALSRKAAAIMVVPVVKAFLGDFGVEAQLVKEAVDDIMSSAAAEPQTPAADADTGDDAPTPPEPGKRPNPREGLPGSPVGSAA